MSDESRRQYEEARLQVQNDLSKAEMNTRRHEVALEKATEKLKVTTDPDDRKRLEVAIDYESEQLKQARETEAQIRAERNSGPQVTNALHVIRDRGEPEAGNPPPSKSR